MPFVDTPNGPVCHEATIREFVTGCTGHMGYTNYIGAGLIVLIIIFIVIIAIIGVIYYPLYRLPLNIGYYVDWWITNKKQGYVHPPVLDVDIVFNVKRLLQGYLTIIVALSLIAMIGVSLYWIGHLAV